MNQKDAFSISADELNHRMELKAKLKDEPCRQAVEILSAALDKVLSSLGVNTEEPNSDTIKRQQEFLGITITENDNELTPQLNGFFIYCDYDNFTPYAWVGAAYLNSMGEGFCEIQWFQKNRMDTVGGLKLVK